MVEVEHGADAFVVEDVRAGGDEERLVDGHGEEADAAIGDARLCGGLFRTLLSGIDREGF